MSYQLVAHNELNGNNNYYIIKDDNKTYVLMHIVQGKFAIYDYEYHDLILKLGPWHPNNGTACFVLRQHHIDAVPDLPYEVNKLVYMHLLIKEYCLKEQSTNEKHILHHLNERKRDNRKENLIWITKNQQRALLKKVGKFYKPPVEVRNIMPELPKHCRWINAKKSFWIDSHPACFLAVENKEQKHKYIESMKGKKHTIQVKFADFMEKYNSLMCKPYGGQESYYKFIEFQRALEATNKSMSMFVSNIAIKSSHIGDIPCYEDDAHTDSATSDSEDDEDDFVK